MIGRWTRASTIQRFSSYTLINMVIAEASSGTDKVLFVLNIQIKISVFYDTNTGHTKSSTTQILYI
jgi:hypothetical protein